MELGIAGISSVSLGQGDSDPVRSIRIVPAEGVEHLDGRFPVPQHEREMARQAPCLARLLGLSLIAAGRLTAQGHGACQGRDRGGSGIGLERLLPGHREGDRRSSRQRALLLAGQSEFAPKHVRTIQVVRDDRRARPSDLLGPTRIRLVQLGPSFLGQAFVRDVTNEPVTERRVLAVRTTQRRE